MISLPCTHCQAVLTIDEAFAGGVCRCQHCGTIQTVPAHLKQGSKTTNPTPAKTLYRNPGNPGRGDSAVGTGLQNLQDQPNAPEERKNRAKRAAAPLSENAPPKHPPQWKLYAAATAVALAGFVLIYLLLFHTR
jgi:hypothetical protein